MEAAGKPPFWGSKTQEVHWALSTGADQGVGQVLVSDGVTHEIRGEGRGSVVLQHQVSHDYKIRTCVCV